MSDLHRRAAQHAALGDAVRLAIVDALAASDLAPSELSDRLGIPSNLAAHHLDVLERVGVISRLVSSGDRRRRYVRLEHGSLPAIAAPAARPQRALFVCTQNSARSQIAAALWRARCDRQASSAGTHPAAAVHPLAVSAAARAGVDISAAVPSALDAVDAMPALVITVCDQAHEEIGASRGWAHWSVPDPVAAGRATAFDRTVVELRERVRLAVREAHR